jgi:hypothetical protein
VVAICCELRSSFSSSLRRPVSEPQSPPSESLGRAALAEGLLLGARLGRGADRVVPAGGVGRAVLRLERPAGADPQRVREGVVDPLEQRVVGQRLLQLLVELQRGQLQQPDRLLELRGQRQMLVEPELQGGLQEGLGIGGWSPARAAALHPEVFSEVDAAHAFVLDDLVGAP